MPALTNGHIARLLAGWVLCRRLEEDRTEKHQSVCVYVLLAGNGLNL